jgi:hypothetical protein
MRLPTPNHSHTSASDPSSRDARTAAGRQNGGGSSSIAGAGGGFATGIGRTRRSLRLGGPIGGGVRTQVCPWAWSRRKCPTTATGGVFGSISSQAERDHMPRSGSSGVALESADREMLKGSRDAQRATR